MKFVYSWKNVKFATLKNPKFKPINCIMKKTILSLAFLLMTLMSYAEMDYTWMEIDTPVVTNIDSTDLACNQGEESFASFISKFRTDASFRNSRVRFDKDDDISVGCFETLGSWNQGNGYDLLRTFHEIHDGWESNGSWYGVSDNQVCFTFFEEYIGEDEDWGGGSGLYARFQRLGDKWYLTCFMCAG